MKTKTVGSIMALLLGLAFVPGSAAGQSTSESCYRKAREVLDAALQAAGGVEALQALKDVARKGSGTAFNQGQSLKVDPPYTTRPVEVTSVSDLARRRSVTETLTTPQGGVPAKARVVLSGESGFAHNLVTNVATPSTPVGLAGLRTALRRDPAALLLTARSRAETLRFLGEGVFEGQPQRVATFADSDGTQIALYVDARTSLLSKYEVLADHPVMGDTLTEVIFSDYRAVGAVKLPFRVVNRTGGEVSQDMKYSEIRANSEPAAGLFEAPKDAIAGTPAGPATTVTLKKLAENVYLVEGSSHHSLFVAFKDHGVLVEAPQGEERSQVVMAAIKETVPGKPIKYVVPTHFHYDHTPGLRAYIATGATIVTTPGNRAFIERLAATPRTIRTDSLSRAPRPPVIEVFEKRRALTDGTLTIELHDIGPNPHVAEAVIAYLPGQKIVFQSDLIGLPADGPLPPASPATIDFVDKVQKLGLQVETIAGSHGRVGTMAEVTRAVASAK